MIPLKYVEMEKGRVFILALSTGESIKTTIEAFCSDKGVINAKITILGGVQTGSSFVCGPHLVDGKETTPIEPIIYTTDAPTEFAGVGTVFPDEAGKPVMHLHGSLGRNGTSITGCFREQAKAWLTLEVIIEELLGKGAVRKADAEKKVAPLSIE